MTGPIIELYNRAPWPLEVIKDGKTTTLQPGGGNYVTADIAWYAKAQHPVPGSEDPNTREFESLVSVVANVKRGQRQTDALDAIPKEVLDLLPKERINRGLLPLDRQGGTTLGTNFPRRRVGIEDAPDGCSLMQADGRD